MIYKLFWQGHERMPVSGYTLRNTFKTRHYQVGVKLSIQIACWFGVGVQRITRMQEPYTGSTGVLLQATSNGGMPIPSQPYFELILLAGLPTRRLIINKHSLAASGIACCQLMMMLMSIMRNRNFDCIPGPSWKSFWFSSIQEISLLMALRSYVLTWTPVTHFFLPLNSTSQTMFYYFYEPQ